MGARGSLRRAQPTAAAPRASSCAAWNIGAKGLTALACAGLFVWARDSLGKTKLNRDLSLVVLAGFVVQALLAVVAALLRIPTAQETAIALFAWALLHLALALTTERRLAVTALAFAAGALLSAAWPKLAYGAQSLSSGCAVLVVLWAWKAADAGSKAVTGGPGSAPPWS